MSDVHFNFIAMGLLLNSKGLTPTEFKLMAMIVRRMNKDGTCYPSISKMAEDAELNRETVKRAIRSLKGKGYLQSTPRYGEDGQQMTNLLSVGDRMGISPHGAQSISPHDTETITKVYTSEVNTTKYSAEGFDEFWNEYPLKKGKAPAMKKWAKMDKNCKEAALRDVCKRKASDDQWTKDGGKYIPHCSTYLNQEQWLDEWEVNTATSSVPDWML